LRSPVLIDRVLLQEAEDVVENVVATRLLGKEERLHELAPRLALVRHLADDLNHNAAICRCLSVDAVNEDFAVLEADGSDLVVNFLRKIVSSSA
jgi:hypothetical protein